MLKQTKALGEELARISQMMILLFFAPFNLFLLYLLFINFSGGGLMFVSLLTTASILIIRNAFSFADIYIVDNVFITKKLFTIKKNHISEYRKIGKGLGPFTYYLEFENSKKVYFLLKISHWFIEVTNLNPDKVLNELRFKFNQLKENEKISAANNY